MPTDPKTTSTGGLFGTNPTSSRELRLALIQMLYDTTPGHLPIAAWQRLLSALEREIAKDVANGYRS